MVQRISTMATRLPEGRVAEFQKTRIDFCNGSVVEAFPNNPYTIRGPSLHLVYCDEMGFIRDDNDLYDAILFTLSATGGTFIASSTPGSSDSLFYKICFDPKFPFSRHHVTWKEALEPHGPLKQPLLDAIRTQLASNQWRWRREMEAEFAEDEESFFSLSLITKAVDEKLSYRYVSEEVTGKSLYAGLDFGKHHDHSAFSVVEYDQMTKTSTVIHMKHFPLETDYSLVIGHVKALCDRWNRVNRITTDTTGVGDVVTQDMRNAGLKQLWGITLTPQSKTDILENLHRMLAESKLKLVYDPDLIAEMNCERYETSKTGQLLFSHPAGTHDDRLWALALACHGQRYGNAIVRPSFTAFLGRRPGYIGPRYKYTVSLNPQPFTQWFPPGR